MLQKNAITEVHPNSLGFYSNVFLVRKVSGGWHPVIDLKQLNTHIYKPYFHMFTISSVLGTIRKGDYGCILPCTNPSRQPEGPWPRIQKQILSVVSASLHSEHSASGIYFSGAHSSRLPLSSRDIGNFISP